MRDALIAIVLCGVAIAACERRDEPARTERRQVAVSDVDLDWSDAGPRDRGEVNIKADVEGGEVELKLPGGIAGKVRLPEGLGDDSKFDLHGIGRYPGARLTSVEVQASGKTDDGRGRVVLGFSAPGNADKVADWYEAALIKRGRSVARTGTIVTGTTRDGDPMVISINNGANGTARGRITITDRNG